MTTDTDAPANDAAPPVEAEGVDAPAAVPKEWIEQAARLAGWDPDHKGYGGKPGLSAEDFLKSVPTRTKRTTDKLFALEGTVRDIAKNFEAQKQAAFERGRAEKERELARAVSEGDGDRVVAIQRELRDIDRKQESAAREQGGTPEPEAVAWLHENPWFNQDDELNEHAQLVERRLLRQGVSDTRTRLDRVSQEIRQRYPEKFGGTRDRTAPRTVEAPANGGAAPRQDGQAVRWQGLDDASKDVFRSLYRTGAWTGKSEEEARALWLKDLPAPRRR